MSIFNACLIVIAAVIVLNAEQLPVRGVVKDSAAGTPLSGVIVRLLRNNLYDTTDNAGRFSLVFDVAGNSPEKHTSLSEATVTLTNGLFSLDLTIDQVVKIQVYSVSGKLFSSYQGRLHAGRNILRIPVGSSGVYFYKIQVGDHLYVHRFLNVNQNYSFRAHNNSSRELKKERSLSDASAQRTFSDDSLLFTRSGYYPAKAGVTQNSELIEMNMRQVILLNGVKPGTITGITGQHESFLITVAPDGKTMTSMSITAQLSCLDLMGTAGRSFTIDGQFTIPSNGVVNIGDSVSLQFLDTSVSGTFNINKNIPGTWKDSCMGGRCVQYNNGSFECSNYFVTNPILGLHRPVTFSSIFSLLKIMFENGVVVKSPDATFFLPEETVSLVVKAFKNHHFSGWSGDTLKTAGDTAWVTMENSKTVKANIFSNYFLKINSNGTISRIPEKESYLPGDTVRLIAKPGLDLCCVQWSGATASGDTAFVVMHSDTIVNAQFTQVFSLSAQGSVGAVINRDPDRDTYIVGDTVRLIALIDSSFCCPVWSGDTLKASGDTAWVVMSAPRAVFVSFTPVCRLFINSQHGQVIKTPDKPYYITSHNETVTLEIKPDPGYLFTGWDGPVSNKTTPTTEVVMNKNQKVSVLFADNYKHTLYRMTSPKINAVGFSPDGLTVAFIVGDSLIIKEKESGAYIRRFNAGSSAGASTGSTIKFSPDGSKCLITRGWVYAYLFDMATGLMAQRYYDTLSLSSIASSGAFSSDGNRVLISLSKSGISFETLSGTPITKYDGSSISLSFTPDQSGVIGGYFSREIHLYDAKTGELQRTFTGDSKSKTSAIIISKDGTTFQVLTEDGQIQQFDISNGTMLNKIAIQGLIPPNCVAISPDGTKAAAGFWNKDLKVVETATGSLTHTLIGHTGPLLCIAFSPDGSQLLSGSADSTVILWDLR